MLELSQMNDIQLYIGYIAGGIALFQLAPYLLSILRGHTKPERATYAIWSLINLLTLVSYYAAGARSTIWVGLAYAVSSILIFALSFKYGMGGMNKFDTFCLLLAGIGIVVWLSTNNPVLALYYYVGIKFLGYLPTLKKAYKLPRTENALSWILAATASILNLFAITEWSAQIAIYPLYCAIGDGLLAAILIGAAFKPRKSLRRKLVRLYEI